MNLETNVILLFLTSSTYVQTLCLIINAMALTSFTEVAHYNFCLIKRHIVS